MIYGLDGLPTPPAGMNERLQRIDPALGVRWVGGLDNGGWAITYQWPPDSPRRAMIQRGEMSPNDDFDAIAFLPADCTVDQAYGFVVNGMKSSRQEAVSDMLNRVDLWNKEATDKMWKAAQAPAMEHAEAVANHATGTAFSAGGIAKESPLTRKRKVKNSDAG